MNCFFESYFCCDFDCIFVYIDHYHHCHHCHLTHLTHHHHRHCHRRCHLNHRHRHHHHRHRHRHHRHHRHHCLIQNHFHNQTTSNLMIDGHVSHSYSILQAFCNELQNYYLGCTCNH